MQYSKILSFHIFNFCVMMQTNENSYQLNLMEGSFWLTQTVFYIWIQVMPLDCPTVPILS